MNRFSANEFIISILVLLAGLLGSYYLSSKVRQQLQTQNYTRLEVVAEKVSVRLQDAIDLAVTDLQALQAHYTASQAVTSEKFRDYMQVLDIQNRSHIQALSWVPLIQHDSRRDFEARARLRYPEFHITERDSNGELIVSGNKGYYTPVTDIAPYESNLAAQGFDLNSNLTRRASLEYARDSGKMTTTAKIRLVQETGDSFGFLIVAPVYTSDHELNDAGQRSRALKGYVTGVFRINSLMEKALNHADDEGLLLALFDLNTSGGGQLYGADQISDSFSFNLSIPDRRWQLKVALNDTLRNSIDSPAVANWIMFGGVIMSILLGLCVYTIQNITKSTRRINELSQHAQKQNKELEAIVAERTKTLAQKNHTLNSHVDELTTQRKVLTSLMEDSQAAKDQAERRSRELARSNRDLDEFAYVASHDLKSPLRGIDQLASWVIEDLEEGNLTEIPENLTIMRQRVRRLETLLNDLLAYSRVSRQQPELKRIECAPLFEEMFMINSPPSGFDFTIHGKLPYLTTAVAPFEQVIRNLLSNAIKHHDQLNGHIQIRCFDEGDYYRFDVQDNGPGINQNHYEQIFKMFKTLKPRDETEGSGMGLALIKKIVEHYSGKVYLTSILGEGTTFSFTWPKNI